MGRAKPRASSIIAGKGTTLLAFNGYERYQRTDAYSRHPDGAITYKPL
jgi:hypothetical protein